jgi:(S)-ureidoglycine-glyoxylate aminotransferase
MLYCAHECARLIVEEGLDNVEARHARAGRAMAEGLKALGLELFGDQGHKMTNVVGVHIPAGVHGDAVRHAMLEDFGIEIGTSFGPLHGKIWRIGTMGVNATKRPVLLTLAALEHCLARAGVDVPAHAGTDAALKVFEEAT